jgi:hypothetical protein
MPNGMYRILSFGHQVGIGVAGSIFVNLNAVAKDNCNNAPYCIPNELISSEIGRFLRLPLPPAGIVIDNNSAGKHWFASLDFNLTGIALPPVNVTRCVSLLPELSTGLLLFDILIANCDRHWKNFSVDFSVSPPRMNIFDHSHALFGFVAGQGVFRLSQLKDKLGVSGGPLTKGNRHCLLDKINTNKFFSCWVNRIKELPDFFIEDVVSNAMSFGLLDKENVAAIDFLKDRRDNIENIINKNQTEFKSIAQWGII